MDKMTWLMKMMISRLGIPHICHVILLLLLLNPSLSAYTWGERTTSEQSPVIDVDPPKFEATPTSITALAGQTVYLPCSVANLRDKVVSWIRTRDLHILTSGIAIYTSDARFEVLHKPHTDAWNLRIMGAQLRDEGKYECQVNTDPKMNLPVFLTIRDNDMKDSPYSLPDARPQRPAEGGRRTWAKIPKASVLGQAEQIVHVGSTVTFTCLVMAPYPQGHPPRQVNWFHGKRLVSFQAERGGISMDTEKSDVQTTSRLTVAGVTQLDAGNYTCQANDVRPASVSLVVVEGEHTEAMQRDAGNHSAARPPPSCLQHHLATFLCILHWWWGYLPHAAHIT